MTTKTRYFVIISLLVLTVGLGTGLLAYYVGFPTSALSRAGGPDELQFVPADAALVAYADVHQIMTSDLRQKVRTPRADEGRRPAAIPERNRDQHRNRHRPVVFAVSPGHDSTVRPGSLRRSGARPVRPGEDRSADARTWRDGRANTRTRASSSRPEHQGTADFAQLSGTRAGGHRHEQSDPHGGRSQGGRLQHHHQRRCDAVRPGS